MAKFELSEDQIDHILENLDDTGGYLIKPSELKFWIEHYVFKEVEDLKAERTLTEDNFTITFDEQQEQIERLKEAAKLKFDYDVEYILGRPNFVVASIAKRLIELGIYEERKNDKAESEQATAIHYMLTMYLQHGKKWQDELQKSLK